MGIFDWLGPTSLGKRRGWDALPAAPPELKASPAGRSAGGLVDGYNAALTIQTLVHGPGTYPWTSDSGNGSGNSAVYACLQAIAVAIAEPEMAVYRLDAGERIAVEDSALGDLLARPNPHFSMDTLLAYLSTCLHVDGNAYWRKLRAGSAETGIVVELWPISPSRITPTTERDSDDFISYYRYYYTSSQYVDLPPADVVHFRYGLDDRDHRIGCSPLKRLAREISSDDQATRYADRLLANLAINGLTLSFDKEAPAIDQAQADELKARVMAAYGGENVGSVAVLSPGGSLTALGFSPEQMDMKTLHRVPEERISAVLGVPAIVAGLGAGLDRSTYANARESREMFTEQKMIPLWRQIASEITMALVPDFSSDTGTVVDFDLTDIRAFADDENAEATRLRTLVEAGIITTDEARAELGLDPRPASAAPVALPAAASRRTVRALAIATKAAEDLPGRYEDLRAAELPTWEAELTAFLDQQLRRVQRRLRAGADAADELVTEGEAVLLGETLTPLQLRVLGEVERLVEAELGISMQLDDPATREYLRRAGANIVGITDTTRRAVQDALIEGQQAGEGIDDLARRLRDLPAFGSARARVVARTELGVSTTQASYASYVASGAVEAIRIFDGDFDAACAARNGRVISLNQAASEPPLLHPNCTAAWAPVTTSATEASA